MLRQKEGESMQPVGGVPARLSRNSTSLRHLFLSEEAALPSGLKALSAVFPMPKDGVVQRSEERPS